MEVRYITSVAALAFTLTTGSALAAPIAVGDATFSSQFYYSDDPLVFRNIVDGTAEQWIGNFDDEFLADNGLTQLGNVSAQSFNGFGGEVKGGGGFVTVNGDPAYATRLTLRGRQTFRKNTANDALRFILSGLQLSIADAGGSNVPGATVWSSVDFGLSWEVGDGSDNPLFLGSRLFGFDAKIEGKRGDMDSLEPSNIAQVLPLTHTFSNFHAGLNLDNPFRLPVTDIFDQIGIGELLTVQYNLELIANSLRGESFARAYLRDPNGGSGLTIEGFEQAPTTPPIAVSEPPFTASLALGLVMLGWLKRWKMVNGRSRA